MPNERIELNRDNLKDTTTRLKYRQRLLETYASAIRREGFAAGNATTTQGGPTQVLQENNAVRLEAAGLMVDIITRVLEYLADAEQSLVEADEAGAAIARNMTRE